MFAPIVVVVGLAVVLGVMLRPRAHRWSSRKARMTMSSATGPDFTMVLGAVGIAGLLFTLAGSNFVGLVPGGGATLAIGAVLLLISVVVFGNRSSVPIAALGLVALIVTTGAQATLELVIITALLVWLLGAIRGWIG